MEIRLELVVIAVVILGMFIGASIISAITPKEPKGSKEIIMPEMQIIVNKYVEGVGIVSDTTYIYRKKQ